MEKNHVLSVDHLSVEFRVEGSVVKALSDVSLYVEEGETLGLVGETGAGKTTTALGILNLIPSPPGIITGGSITVCGHEMLKLRKHALQKIRGKDVSMIFQDPMTSLNPVKTVGEQIAESIALHENLKKDAAYKKAQEMLEMVGIPGERAQEYPHQFSGGMKQRVVIAMALACNPKLLIADEPTTALDVTIQAQVLDLMNELRAKLNTSVIMITHDLGIIAEVCDRVAVMYAGRIVEQGSLDEVFNHTLHPYTEGLFNSLPNIKDPTAKLIPIPGLMPDPTDLPQGCSFAPRCKYACEACSVRVPELAEIREGHSVRCCRYQESDFRIERNQKDE